MTLKNSLSANMEDYLEAIYILSGDSGVARVKDISRQLEVKSSSVSSALKVLSAKGLVEHERYGYAQLTEAGRKEASKVLRRHKTLIKFLTDILDINMSDAKKDACRIEHSLSPDTFKRLTKFMTFVENCPQGKNPQWLDGFHNYLKTGKHQGCNLKN